MLCIRSYRFISVSLVPVNEIADALLTSISIPPNFLTASSIAPRTCFSSLTSTIHGKHFPPADSTKKNKLMGIFLKCYLRNRTFLSCGVDCTGQFRMSFCCFRSDDDIGPILGCSERYRFSDSTTRPGYEYRTTSQFPFGKK